MISDDYALFVSPHGSPDLNNCGTRANPCHGLTGVFASALSQNKKRIYVCDDQTGYDEEIQLDGVANGFEVYGGFTCSEWQYVPASNRAVFRNPEPDKPWFIKNVTGGVTFDAIEVISGNATTPSGSSIAVVVTGSDNVVFRRSVFKSGAAGPGEMGVTGPDGLMGPQIGADQAGKAADCLSPAATQPGGAWDAPNSCGSKGGAGAAAQLNHPGSTGGDGEPALSVNGGLGGTGSSAGSLGGEGAVGIDGASGPPAGKLGVLQPVLGAFYLPADGFDGTDGGPGQGGGGGGSSAGTATCLGASGGAGGMGGCGGKKGSGGHGGGASVGLLAFNSSISLDATSVYAGMGGSGFNGGHGGRGGYGSMGAPGGGGNSGGGGGTIGPGGQGGYGGSGGRGGCGSGGTGGPSIAIAYVGSAPTRINQSELHFDLGGGGGYGGSYCATPAPNGQAGLSADMLDVGSP